MKYIVELDDVDKILRVLSVDADFTHEKMLDLTSRLSPNRWVLIDNDTREPAIGMVLDLITDKFFFARPYPSWVWNESEWMFDPPTPNPGGKENWQWNEETLTWVNHIEGN
jgi:hypothetical protein